MLRTRRWWRITCLAVFLGSILPAIVVTVSVAQLGVFRGWTVELSPFVPDSYLRSVLAWFALIGIVIMVFMIILEIVKASLHTRD